MTLRPKLLYLLMIVLTCCGLGAQNSAIEVSEKNKDVGSVANVYKLSAEFLLKNNLSRNLFLLKADVSRNLTVRVAKKTIKPGDTVFLVIDYTPLSAGHFSEDIKLVTSADADPLVLSLSGTIVSIKPDDKTACFYFKRPNPAGAVKDGPLVVKEDNTPKDVSNRIPDHTSQPVESRPQPRKEVASTTKQPETPKSKDLDEALYKPNNILFLIDVSNSMRDSTKLPLMKLSLHRLIDALRDIDKVTFVTYADSVKLLKEGLSGNRKPEMHELVDGLKGHGLTKGNKAILYSLDVAQRNYISGGNNEIILATDGKFRFYSEDYGKWKKQQQDKHIVMSTVGFGNDKDAIKTLKEIAEKGEGEFIHIRKRSDAATQLLDEIRQRSKR